MAFAAPASCGSGGAAGKASACRKRAGTLRWARGREGCSDSPPTSGLHPPRNATTATAASGGNREQLLGQRPARRECRPRHEADAGCRNRRQGLHALDKPKEEVEAQKASVAPVGAIALTLFSLLHLKPLSRCATAPPRGSWHAQKLYTSAGNFLRHAKGSLPEELSKPTGFDGGSILI